MPAAAITNGPAVTLPVSAQKPVAPEWVHLLPAGTITTKDGRGPYTVPDAQAVIALSMQAANNRPLPIDYDHQIDKAADKGGQAPAAAWIVEMQARADGIWGRVEWTREGGRRVAEREYRFLSPVFAHTPRNEVLLIARASVTNNPNLPQLVSLNSAGTPMDTEAFLASLRKKLALPATADHVAMLAAVDEALTARNSADPAKFVPLAMFEKAVAEAAKANQGLSKHAAEAEVERAIGRNEVLPWMKGWAVELCMANKPAYDGFVGGVGQQVKALVDTLAKPAFPGKDWGASPVALHHQQQKSTDDVAGRLGLSDADLKKYGPQS